jgi:hypothetical protein
MPWMLWLMADYALSAQQKYKVLVYWPFPFQVETWRVSCAILEPSLSSSVLFHGKKPKKIFGIHFLHHYNTVT